MQSIDRNLTRAAALPGMAGLILALYLVLAFIGLPELRAADQAAATPSQQVPIPYTFEDSFRTEWLVQQDGSIGANQADIYDAGGRLLVGGAEQYNPNAQTALFDQDRNELTFPSQRMASLDVSRRISVESKQGWCRWIEIFENPTGSAIKTQVHLNFTLGSAVVSSQNVIDPKTHKTIGLAVFDGIRGIAMLGAGHGSNLVPIFAPQQGQNTVDMTWDIEVPAHKTAAIIHLQAIRANVNDAQTFMEKVSDKQILRDLPPALTKTVLNFPRRSLSFGDLDLLRGDLLDIIELRSGDQYKGTIQEKTFALQTTYGMVSLQTDKILGMLAVGDFRPTQLVVTRDGEAFGGILQSPIVHIQLSSGQITPVPVNSIKRLGLRKQQNDPEEFKYEHPMLILRNGDRIAVEMPASPIPVSTRYGNLLLTPQSIGALIFQAEDQPVHQILLTDGSRISAIVAQNELELRPLSTGAAGPIRFPVAAVSRLQFAGKIDEPGDQSPVLSLSTGDRLAAALGGKLQLDTAFDTIEIDGAEVRGVRHVGSGPTELQVLLWDDTTLSGRLKGDVIDMMLKGGAVLHVPAALLEQYTQPQPLPPASVLEKIRGLVADLASDDWKRADRASSELNSMGPRITSALKSIRNQQAKPVQDRIDSILAKYQPRDEPQTQPAEAGDDKGM